MTVVRASAPRPIVIKTSGKASKGRARRVAHAVGSFALAERHRMGAIAGGFILGMVDKSDFADKIPTLPFLGKAGTLGLAAWGVAKATKSQWANDAATGFLAIAAYELAKEGSISGPAHAQYDTSGYVSGM